MNYKKIELLLRLADFSSIKSNVMNKKKIQRAQAISKPGVVQPRPILGINTPSMIATTEINRS